MITVERIEAAFGSGGFVDRAELDGWLASEDIEVLGCVFAFLEKRAFRQRIRPVPSADAFWEPYLRYLARCLRENPRGEWTESAYEAAWALRAWFERLWSSHPRPTRVLKAIKAEMEQLIQLDNTKEVLVNGTLEHLFERNSIRTFFNDWHNRPDLADSYEAASAWASASVNPDTS